MTRRTLLHLCALALVTSLAACGSDTKPGAADTGADAVITDTGEVDAADTAVADTEPVQNPPWANVYAISPAESSETTQVELAHLTSEDGRLEGAFARVRNCLPDIEGGQKIPVDLGGALSLVITACKPGFTALPAATGDYLAIKPPATAAANDGTFAEVMMYHHMQVVHDYYKDVHGLTDRDAPLDALVDVQAHIDLCDQWAKLPNAAFIPKEGLEQLPFGLGTALDLAGDAIVFSGTDTKDFSFDATVIYHEYTHAMLGATRLGGIFADDRGLNNLPGALNEAYADYFATTLIDASLLGTYSLNDLGEFAICGIPLGGGGNQARDLDNGYTCPGDLTAEVHADSELFSGALWEIRELLGAEDADRIILAAVLTLTDTSDFTAAAEATIDEAAKLRGTDVEAQVRERFTARGLIGCSRVLPVDRIGQRGLDVAMPSPDDFGGANPYGDYAAGYLQYAVEVPEGAQQLTLTFEFTTGGLGGLLGGGGTPNIAVDVAVRQGAAPLTYTVAGAAIGVDADAVVAMDSATKQVTLSGTCLVPGSLVFALHNIGDAVSLHAVTVETSTEAPSATNFDSCPR